MSKLSNISIEKIKLDKSNPRIAKFLEYYKDITEDHLRLALSSSASGDSESSGSSFSSLRDSIKTYGGIIQPIILCEQGDDTYRVIEGNTRVAIYKSFKADGVSGDWDTIPAIVYSQLDEKGVDAIRLQAHLVGPREWDPYSKAKYLHTLAQTNYLTMNELVEYCGGKKQEVVKYIQAYKDMEKYYRDVVTDDEYDVTRFSAFVEAQQPRVRTSLERHGYSMRDFSIWVRDGKIYPLNTVRSLPRILEHPKAKAVFLESGAKKAMTVIEAPPANPDIDSMTLHEIGALFYSKVQSIAYSDIRRMRELPESDETDLLSMISSELEYILEEINK